MPDEITGISYWGGSHVQDGHLQWMTWQIVSSHVAKTVDYGIIKRGHILFILLVLNTALPAFTTKSHTFISLVPKKILQCFMYIRHEENGGYLCN